MPAASAILDVSSTDKGFAPPRMTLAQKNAIASPLTGLQVFDTVLGTNCFYDGSQWRCEDAQEALWEEGVVRYYAVDYDNGDDTNAGYSDASMAAAGVVALKTLEQLRLVLPRTGNGRTAVIAVAARAAGATYRNIADSADDILEFVGFSGYQKIVVRGTGTVATAGATAFANDTADKIACGAKIATGTNVGGYNPSGSISTSTFDCQLSGGGAPGLTAEPALVGKRIRFDSTTATVALQNVCRMIYSNDTDTITVDRNLPATPTASDVFYIEDPGVVVGGHIVSGYKASVLAPDAFNNAGLTFAGFTVTGTVTGFGISSWARSVDATLEVAFCEATTGAFNACNWSTVTAVRVGQTYTDEANTVITVGPGWVTDGWSTLSTSGSFILASSVCRTGRWQILQITGVFTVREGCAIRGRSSVSERQSGRSIPEHDWE